ncbi:MAG: M48 family metallopeptidase [Oscillospiraceae bacterium]|jgi:predicted metal-dependent hydrolase|nr:M48 family metallopeptidase [Oscillospiraceae bacterium]
MGIIKYTIIRSNRKTMTLRVTPEVTVEVRAPLKLPTAEIDAFVQSKQSWIVEHLVIQDARREQREAFAPRYGDTVTFLGRQLPIVAAGRAAVDGGRFCIPAGLNSKRIKEACVLLYKAEARRIITEKVGAFAAAMNVRPSAVRINSATARWGSCSAKNSLNFSWRLVMADEDIVDYVVVHELAHIMEHNHSGRFWAVVGGVLPDYRALDKRLKPLQEKLAREDWSV